jgi:uncharacterized repeat protein (TIGR01451 family)
VNDAKEITVDDNGDNSIETNSFNVNDGANCIEFHFPQIRVTKTPHSQSVTSGGTATWTITVTNTGDVTLTDVHTTDAQAPGCEKTDAQIAAIPPHNSSTFAPGDTVSYQCSKTGVVTAFKNVVVACGMFQAAAVCDDDPATLDDRTGAVIVASTQQNFAPNDSATLSGLTNPNGNLRFKLYKGACTVPANLIFDSGDIPVGADGTFSTTNAQTLTQLLTTAGLPTATGGTYNWLVTYSGDTNGNAGITIACGTENFVVTNT